MLIVSATPVDSVSPPVTAIPGLPILPTSAVFVQQDSWLPMFNDVLFGFGAGLDEVETSCVVCFKVGAVEIVGALMVVVAGCVVVGALIVGALSVVLVCLVGEVDVVLVCLVGEVDVDTVGEFEAVDMVGELDVVVVCLVGDVDVDVVVCLVVGLLGAPMTVIGNRRDRTSPPPTRPTTVRRTSWPVSSGIDIKTSSEFLGSE